MRRGTGTGTRHDTIPPERLGGLLRDLRRRRGLARRAAARAVGLDRRALGDYERGRRAVPDADLERLAALYDVPVAELVPVREPVRVTGAGLVAGTVRQPVADDGTAAMLDGYVDLLARLRGTRPGGPVPMRATDLSALAVALDTDPAAVERRLVDLMGCTPAEATRLHAELRRRLLVPVAGVAFGMGMFAGSQAVGADRPAAGPAAVAPVTVAAGASEQRDAATTDTTTDTGPSTTAAASTSTTTVLDAAPPTTPTSPPTTAPPVTTTTASPATTASAPPAGPPDVGVLPGEVFVEVDPRTGEPLGATSAPEGAGDVTG